MPSLACTSLWWLLLEQGMPGSHAPSLIESPGRLEQIAARVDRMKLWQAPNVVGLEEA